MKALDDKWIARNKAYRRPPTIWELRNAYDRARVMEDVAILCGRSRRNRVGLVPKRPRSPWGLPILPELVRHLVIEGYDRPARRWLLRRSRTGMYGVTFAAGLIVAAMIAYVGAHVAPLQAAGLSVIAGVDLLAAGGILAWSIVQISPVVTASAYAQQWLRHMPRSRVMPRFRRLY